MGGGIGCRKKLTEACQNGGEKKEGGGDWAENGSVPAQSLGWLGDRAAGWDGMGWKMDGIWNWIGYTGTYD